MDTSGSQVTNGHDAKFEGCLHVTSQRSNRGGNEGSILKSIFLGLQIFLSCAMLVLFLCSSFSLSTFHISLPFNTSPNSHPPKQLRHPHIHHALTRTHTHLRLGQLQLVGQLDALGGGEVALRLEALLEAAELRVAEHGARLAPPTVLPGRVVLEQTRQMETCNRHREFKRTSRVLVAMRPGCGHYLQTSVLVGGTTTEYSPLFSSLSTFRMSVNSSQFFSQTPTHTAFSKRTCPPKHTGHTHVHEHRSP